MVTSLLSGFLVATRVATGVTVIGVAIMAINAVDAIYGDKIESFLSETKSGMHRGIGQSKK